MRPSGAVSKAVSPSPLAEPAGLSRRNFLLGAGALTLLGLSARSAGAQTSAAVSRPRLVATPSKWASLRAAIPGNPNLKARYDAIKAKRSAMLAAPNPTAAEWSLYTAREMRDRVVALGALHNLDGDAAAGDKVRDMVLYMTTSTAAASWRPPGNANSGGSTWLAHGEISMAVAIGYDWAYGRFTNEQRTRAEDGAKARGVVPWTNHPPHDYNWGAVIGGGMGLLLLALQGETTGNFAGWFSKLDSDLRNGVVWDESKSGPLAPHTVVYPSGGEKEGTGYAAYFMERLTAFFAGYETAKGAEHPLYSQMPGVKDVGRFVAHCAGPNGYELRFSDGTDEKVRAEKRTWIGYHARKAQDDWGKFLHDQAPAHGWIDGGDAVWWMLFHAGAGRSPSATGEPLGRYFQGVGVFAARTSWSDTQAAYLAGRISGDVDEGHTQLDRGSFVYQALGQNFVVDLGEDSRGPDYDAYEHPTVESGDRWDYYRLRAEGHNTFTINLDAEPDQRAAPKERGLVPRVVKVGTSVAVADMLPVYSGRAPWGNVTRAMRGMRLRPDGVAVVQTEVSASENVVLDEFLHVRKRSGGLVIDGDGKGATIQPASGGPRCYVKLLTPGQFVKKAAVQKTALRGNGQNANSIYEKLAVTRGGSRAYTNCIALHPLSASAQKPTSFPPVVPLADW